MDDDTLKSGSSTARTRWWTPGRADWQVAAAFVVGSTCFAVGSLPIYVSWVGLTADSITYFVGSLFFTLAAGLQLSLSTGLIRPDERPRAGVNWRSRVRRVDRPEWWSSAVQFAGTLLFNVSTFAAMQQGLTVAQIDRAVWRPDVYGSICFLVASALVFADVRRPWLRWRPRDLGWSVAMLNMAGSIAFGISAVAAKVIPATGDLRNAELANLGTFVGAIGFFVGAIVLIPAQAADDR